MTADRTTDGLGRRSEDIEEALAELAAIRSDMVTSTAMLPSGLEEVHPNFRASAQNLLHYLAMRRRDLRPLQIRLAAMGLSSLGRAESHVMATVDAVIGVLQRLADLTGQPALGTKPVVDFAKGQQLLADHTNELLGAAPKGRGVRIMVTMPSEAADDYLLVQNLLQQGMDCMRINCAHDDAAAWSRMIDHLDRAKRCVDRPCLVVMDLAGPKLRTGPVEPGPKVIRIRPRRNDFGRVTAPARVWLTSDTAGHPPPSKADACLQVSSDWLGRLRRGERLKFTDARDAKRSIEVVDLAEFGCWAEATKTAYIAPGTVLRRGSKNCKGHDRKALIADPPPRENAIDLHEGDLLIVRRDLEPGRSATYDADGQVLIPAEIGCTIPEVFKDVQPGESIWFDDGKIGGRIESVESTRILVRITGTSPTGGKLRANKGINLPESEIRLAAMTDKDIADLSFVARHADIVELSFANSARDVEFLQKQLASFGNGQPGVVLKIETRRGFENLPEMLLAAMRMPRCGVMIARGDLAVECGFERLAEVQEEILWICEAAHVPVIWATQVLETLAKVGVPSRAEITDAAMGHRAECVMLNKGPHVVRAVGVLDDILKRMQAHQTKKQSMLRELRLAHALSADEVVARPSQTAMKEKRA